MKFFYQILFMACIFVAGATVEARVKVTPKNHTCSELVDMLHDHGSIWVRGFLGFYDNVALQNPRCSGAYSHPDRVCRYFIKRVRAQDGRCRLGPSCACQIDHDDDD